MPLEENSKASTAKTVMGFLAAVSLFVLMFLAFHNNAATVELAQRALTKIGRPTAGSAGV